METQPMSLCVFISLCQPFVKSASAPPVTLKGSYTELIHLNKLHPIHYLFLCPLKKSHFSNAPFYFLLPVG